LLQREGETGISARLRGINSSNIKVVDRAKVPFSPAKPNKKMNMILGFLIGLFGGLGLAFLFDHLDDSIRSKQDIEKYAEIPFLGIVPVFRFDGFNPGYGYKENKRSKAIDTENETREFLQTSDKENHEDTSLNFSADEEKTGNEQKIESIELISHFLPKSIYSENYRSIRAALLLSSADNQLKGVAVSSPYPKEGKTATVSNLAVTLAQTDQKVILVDSDLRKPKLHNIFMIKNSSGLTNYLTSDMGTDELIKPTSIENLFVINAGPVPPNPAELLNSERMSILIRSLKQIFDYVLFDTPPILTVSDALVLSSKLDGMILVVWGEKTSGEALKRTKEKLEMARVKILGAVINNLKIRKYDTYYRDNNSYKSYENDREGLVEEKKRSGKDVSLNT